LSYEKALRKVSYQDNKDFLKKAYRIIQEDIKMDFNKFSLQKYEEIIKKIKNSDFYNEVVKIGLLGSTNDDEAIKGWSDLDILFILKSDKFGNIDPKTIIKIRNFNKKINYLYPNLNISFLTHTYDDLKKYVSYSYLETYRFATFTIEKDNIIFSDFLSDIIKSRGINKNIKKRYAVYYLRHLRFNLLRKIASEDLFDNKKVLKRIIDKVVEIITILSSYYDIRVQGKINTFKELQSYIISSDIVNILSQALDIRFNWDKQCKISDEELLVWIQNLNRIESFILKDNTQSTPEELMNK